jgi:hypothetical protein
MRLLFGIKSLLTHVSFVLECVFASAAVEMSRTLTVENTVLNYAFFCGPISLESFLIDCRVLAVVV